MRDRNTERVSTLPRCRLNNTEQPLWQNGGHTLVIQGQLNRKLWCRWKHTQWEVLGGNSGRLTLPAGGGHTCSKPGTGRTERHSRQWNVVKLCTADNRQCCAVVPQVVKQQNLSESQCYSVRFVTVMELDKKEENREVERLPRGHTPLQ